MSIRAESLSFGYGEHKVIEEISFEGKDDRIISILGPNGVGKTTLLKCLCNILHPDHGSVTLDGENVGSMSRMEVAKRISYVPQRSTATRTSVFDSVLIGRRPHMNWSLTKKDLTITRDVIRTVGLSKLSMRNIDEISGGEFQKVQIARAIVQETKVLILDEPTSSLDVANQYVTLHLLLDTVRERKVCTIMTMHDINLASYCSDELIFMKGGRITAQGPPNIVTSDLIRDVYGIDVDVIAHNGVPFVAPNRPLGLLH
jgi:iron complex transport system ATP-binding protein